MPSYQLKLLNESLRPQAYALTHMAGKVTNLEEFDQFLLDWETESTAETRGIRAVAHASGPILGLILFNIKTAQCDRRVLNVTLCLVPDLMRNVIVEKIADNLEVLALEFNCTAVHFTGLDHWIETVDPARISALGYHDHGDVICKHITIN